MVIINHDLFKLFPVSLFIKWDLMGLLFYGLRLNIDTCTNNGVMVTYTWNCRDMLTRVGFMVKNRSSMF